MAGVLDLAIDQGAVYRKRITRRRKDDNSIISMVGWTAKMQIRTKVNEVTVLDELTTENGRLIVEVDGSLLIDFPDNVTAAYAFTTAFYDLFVTNPDGDSKKLLKGKVTVTLSITR